LNQKSKLHNPFVLALHCLVLRFKPAVVVCALPTHKFTLDVLVKVAAALGCTVKLLVKRAA
jgi:hypothetical protein